MKHTPGPWAFKDGMQLVVGPAVDPEGDPVAEIVGHPEQAFDNASLIARAPELQECCRELLELLQHSDVQFLICNGAGGNLGESAWYNRVINRARKAVRS